MKILNDTIGNRTCDLPACSTVPQPTAPPCAPFFADGYLINGSTGCDFILNTDYTLSVKFLTIVPSSCRHFWGTKSMVRPSVRAFSPVLADWGWSIACSPQMSPAHLHWSLAGDAAYFLNRVSIKRYLRYPLIYISVARQLILQPWTSPLCTVPFIFVLNLVLRIALPQSVAARWQRDGFMPGITSCGR